MLTFLRYSFKITILIPFKSSLPLYELHFRLQILRLHNNHLTSLPEEMSNMKRLSVLILAFNHFTTVPQVLLRLHGSSETMDSIIMAGNYIERLPGDLLSRMKLIKKIDFRMNRLTLLPSEIAKFQCLEFMTHLDIRDNNIQNLDIRSLKGLVYVNCERNSMYTLQLSGTGLKYVYAAHNGEFIFGCITILLFTGTGYKN